MSVAHCVTVVRLARPREHESGGDRRAKRGEWGHHLSEEHPNGLWPDIHWGLALRTHDPDGSYADNWQRKPAFDELKTCIATSPTGSGGAPGGGGAAGAPSGVGGSSAGGGSAGTSGGGQSRADIHRSGD